MDALKTAKKQLAELSGGPVQEPKNAAKADLCIACFSISRGKDPADAAKDLSKKKPPALFSHLEADGPYLNAFFSNAFYEEALAEAESDAFGR
ncbi:MAG: hypothetical protein Q8P02_00480, partial [Candidatus Micrarchaeota archaeon]|nr:hypothetical protein [Candidatus Micrarchaeota archaeon]